MVRWLFGIYWLVLYLKFVIDFLDLYLDSIILTKQGVKVFFWDWLLKYSTEIIEWNSVDAVYDKQEGLLDMILNKWSINIKRIDGEYKFEDVYKPSFLSSFIMEIKDKILGNNQEPEEQPIDKFELLVEVLWEIIKEYYNKK